VPSGTRSDVPQEGGNPVSQRVSAETASQQLGHSSSAIIRELCISKRVIAVDVALVLEEFADTGSDPAFAQIRAGSFGRADRI
jgi:hypothetical protein